MKFIYQATSKELSRISSNHEKRSLRLMKKTIQLRNSKKQKYELEAKIGKTYALHIGLLSGLTDLHHAY